MSTKYVFCSKYPALQLVSPLNANQLLSVPGSKVVLKATVKFICGKHADHALCVVGFDRCPIQQDVRGRAQLYRQMLTSLQCEVDGFLS